MVGYAQKRVTGIQDLERRYALQLPSHTDNGGTTVLYPKMIGGPSLHVDVVIGSMKQATPSASDSSLF